MKAEVLEFSMNNDEKNVALDGAISQIEKAFGKGSVMKLGDNEQNNMDIQSISTGSLGLDIALGMMHRPTILFLDEPTTGLDPQNRTNLWDTILKLKKEDLEIIKVVESEGAYGAEKAAKTEETVESAKVVEDLVATYRHFRSYRSSKSSWISRKL